MQEILRIVHGKQDKSKIYGLRDYNLNVYRGELIYIQGLSGSGMKGIVELLTGTRPLIDGKLYIHEEEVLPQYNKNPENYHIYSISSGSDLVEDLTVAENLEVVRRHSKVLKLFRQKKEERKSCDFLEREGIEILVSQKISMLSMAERLKLSLLKAKMHGAELIIIDCIREDYQGKLGEEICEIVKKMKRENTAFIILSEKYSIFAELAGRIQLIHQGRDIMEWSALHKDITDILKGKGIIQNVGRYKQEKEKMASCIGMYDYEWPLDYGIWNYLASILSQDTEVLEITADKNVLKNRNCFDGKTAIITKDSADCLVDKLTIEDNIILPIPNRIGRGFYGRIPKKLKYNITRNYYDFVNLPYEIHEIFQLNRVQRKILSIYRWEIARPETIVLESPFWGMDPQEMELLQVYILHLQKKGICFICFSKSLDELESFCNTIIISKNGKAPQVRDK